MKFGREVPIVSVQNRKIAHFMNYFVFHVIFDIFVEKDIFLLASNLQF